MTKLFLTKEPVLLFTVVKFFSEAINSDSHNVIIVLLLSIALNQVQSIAGIVKNTNDIALIVLCLIRILSWRVGVG